MPAPAVVSFCDGGMCAAASAAEISAVSPAQADERRVESVEPCAQAGGRVALRVVGDEYHLDPARVGGWHILERLGDVRHVHRTDVGAVGIAEEEQDDVSVGFLAEVERAAFGIGQRERRLFLGGDSARPRTWLVVSTGVAAAFRSAGELRHEPSPDASSIATTANGANTEIPREYQEAIR